MRPKVRASSDEGIAVIGAYFNEADHEIVIGGPIAFAETIRDLSLHIELAENGRIEDVEKDWKQSRTRVIVHGADQDTWEQFLKVLSLKRWRITHVRSLRRLLG